METFKIEIKETLSKIIEIESNSVEDAILKVEKLYKSEEIVLDWNNHVDTEILELNS
ncbi:MAG: protein dpnD [Paludibacter sp.]|nr:protein dpnD [Paludibacter sp.]